MIYCRPPTGCGNDVATGKLIADHSLFLLTCANPKPDDERMPCPPAHEAPHWLPTVRTCELLAWHHVRYPEGRDGMPGCVRGSTRHARVPACLHTYAHTDRMNLPAISPFLSLVMRKADSTLGSSQAVPHPSTNRALCRLTPEVRRDPVHSTWYGRQRYL